MKKIFALILVTALLLCGCGGGSNEEESLTLDTAKPIAEEFLTANGKTGYSISNARYLYEPGATAGYPLVEFVNDSTGDSLFVLVKSHDDVNFYDPDDTNATNSADENADVKAKWLGSYVNSEGFLIVINDSFDTLGFTITSSFKYTPINVFGMPESGSNTYQFSVDGNSVTLTRTEEGIEFFSEVDIYSPYNGLYTSNN